MKFRIDLLFIASLFLPTILFTSCTSFIETRTSFEPLKIEEGKKTVNSHEKIIGFEIIEIQSPNSLRAWVSTDISLDEFTDLKLPLGWFKNQPREIAIDGGRFLKSPFTKQKGEYLLGEAFSFNWWHSATVIDANVKVDKEGILKGSKVHKFHEITIDKGSILKAIVSPDNDVYVLISRDANRTQETPTIPVDWRLVSYKAHDHLVFLLPPETLNIRTDNEDSFQGPVKELSEMF